jgi:hypothetical protein
MTSESLFRKQCLAFYGQGSAGLALPDGHVDVILVDACQRIRSVAK